VENEAGDLKVIRGDRRDDFTSFTVRVRGAKKFDVPLTSALNDLDRLFSKAK
jgi:hypothetical protein